tara:strand:+ start:87 stop:596 length:510 start_codon:yes stop_codon:yes gene_type:complete
MKVPDLEKLVEFTPTDLSKIVLAVSNAHKKDVIDNARGPKRKFKELSRRKTIEYNGEMISYREYKNRVYRNDQPNLFASGDMFKTFKPQGKPSTGVEFSVKYGITDAKQAEKMNRHLTGVPGRLPRRAISESDKPLPDPAIKVLLAGLAKAIQRNFKKITKLDVQIVEI